MLKATDLCANEPEKAAQKLVEDGFAPNYDQALGVLTHLRYDAWREIDTEHSLRFYAEQMQNLGQLKTRPADDRRGRRRLRFLNELKLELKA